jgi:two-component system, NtrC family, sensor kinase
MKKKKIFVLVFLLVLISGLFGKIGGNEVRDSILYEKYAYYCTKAELRNGIDSVLYYSKLAIDYANKHDINARQALVLFGLGNMQSGKATLALESFFKAARLYEKNNNYVGLATAYGYVAETYSIQQNFENANRYLEKAIKIFETEKDSSRLAYAFHNLAFSFYTQNYRLDSALYYFTKAKSIFDILGVETESAYCIGNSGLVYFKQGKIDKAEINLIQAIEILQKYNDFYAITEFMETQAKILQKKGKLKPAIACGLKCYNLSVSNKIADRIRDVSKNLAEFYSENKQFDSAYFFHKIYSLYNDSINNIESVQHMADLRTSYEVSQKQAEVDKLKSRRNFYMVIMGTLAIIILLAIGMIYLYYLNLKRVKKFTRTLEKQGKDLQNSNQVKDKFFSIISHDLRSPISSLSAISLMINESLEHNNKEILVEASDYIDKTVFSLTALLENLLNWAMSEQGRFPYSFEDIDIKQLISDEVRTLATIAISKNIHLKLQLEDELVMVGDNNSLKTIIRNLLSNAYKFTNKGGFVEIATRKLRHNEAEIIVADNGVGIPEEKLRNLFDLKADKSTRGTDKEKGLGLGLTLIHEFVSKNNGNISVLSKPNEGTQFIITFPLKS